MTHSHCVSTQWLADNLDQPDLVVLDASWYLPAQQRDAAAEYAAGHIPGAVRFDIDALSDHSSPLPHMLPEAKDFAKAVGAMGIGPQSRVVIYDGLGLFSAARVWWTFKRFGHEFVAVLSGGSPLWRKEGRAWTQNLSTPKPQSYPLPPNKAINNAGVADLEQIKAWSADKSVQLVDARAADRFRGEAPEPRAGLKSGHIPNSFNLPFGLLLRDGQLKPKEDIIGAFSAAGVDLSRPVATTCGSGVTAAILAIALDEIGHPVTALYDGSWSEWGGRDDVEIAKGA